MFNDILDGRMRDARADPALGQAGTLESLLACLDALRERFKDSVARLIGSSAARTVARFVRLLLGSDDTNTSEEDETGHWADGHRRTHWDEDDDDDWDGKPQPAGGRQPTLLAGIAAGLLTLLTWLAPLAAWAGTLLG